MITKIKYYMKNTRATMRFLHRYIGFFMAGIMAVYAISGVLLIYRDTDFLKKEKNIKKKIEANIPAEKLGKELKIKGFEVKEQKGDIIIFKDGTYNIKTGEAQYTKKELPFFLKKMTDLHKSQSKDKLSILNTIFGISLFFFVISSFWMFNPKSRIFRNGMIITVLGGILALFLILI